MNNNSISVKEAAALLALTTRRVTALCAEGKLDGAKKSGKSWSIPAIAVNLYLENHTALSKTAKLPCPIGYTSYAEIANTSYYVDKTLLVKAVLDEKQQIILFTRPRRFGKTLAMDMLRVFFEKQTKDTRKYFYKRKIWQCGLRYTKEQGKYPVIWLSFKDMKFNNWQHSFEAFQLVIKDFLQQHKELQDSNALDFADKAFYKRALECQLSYIECVQSLKAISRMLSKHYKQKVIIIIDEYDTPIQQGYIHGFYDDVIAFMRNFFSSSLKDNLNLEKGFLTGILRVSKENLFSGLNNIVVDTIFEHKYSEFFGFTDAEVQEMAQYYDCPACFKELKAWYDGYNFGGKDIYNPWSVVNYFSNDCIPKPYWVNTSDNLIIRELLSNISDTNAEDIAQLVSGKNILTNIDLSVIYPHIKNNINTVYSFLMMAGYLKPVEFIGSTESNDYCLATIPNKEIHRIYYAEVINWLGQKTSEALIQKLQKGLLLGNSQLLEESLNDFLIQSASYWDTAKESFYHGMLLGMTGIMTDRYYIKSNREAGSGRFDLLLEPKLDKARLPGIVIEFKVCGHNESNLEAMATKAIEQIKSKRYYEELLAHDCQKVLAYGLAFAGKACSVKKEQLG